MFELYPPPKPQSQIFAIPSSAIFELVLTIPDVTLEEVEQMMMQTLPRLSPQRHSGKPHCDRRDIALMLA